jgi:glutamate--cysteine ligase
MMQSTCSIQASFDYADERDVVRKTRLALAAQPLVAALFANSPFAAGRPSGFSSVRNHVWANTDADRCGIPEFFFEPSMSFERYVRWVMRVPLYSVVRGGHHVDMTRYTFADLLAGRPADVSPATVDDFELQLNAVSTEARLKSVLEMRGADSGSTEMVTALAALWCGLLYDDDALESAWEHFGSWSAHDRASLYARTPALSMGDLVGETSVRARLEALLDSSAAGLARRAVRHPANGADERVYLEPLFELLESSSRQSERLLRAYNGAWRQSTEPVLERCGP